MRSQYYRTRKCSHDTNKFNANKLQASYCKRIAEWNHCWMLYTFWNVVVCECGEKFLHSKVTKITCLWKLVQAAKSICHSSLQWPIYFFHHQIYKIKLERCTIWRKIQCNIYKDPYLHSNWIRNYRLMLGQHTVYLGSQWWLFVQSGKTLQSKK